ETDGMSTRASLLARCFASPLRYFMHPPMRPSMQARYRPTGHTYRSQRKARCSVASLTEASKWLDCSTPTGTLATSLMPEDSEYYDCENDVQYDPGLNRARWKCPN